MIPPFLNFRKECDGIIFSSQSFCTSTDPSPYERLSGIGTTTIMYTVIIVPTQVSSLEFLSTFFRNVLSLNWHYPTTAIQDSTRYNTAYLVELIVYPVGHVIISSVWFLHLQYIFSTSIEETSFVIACIVFSYPIIRLQIVRKRTYRYIYHAHS